MEKDEDLIKPSIEKNPFFKHYEYNTLIPFDDIQTEQPKKWIKKQPLRNKILLKQTSLPYYNTKVGDSTWLTQKFDDTDNQDTWTCALPQTITTNKDAYNFGHLLEACGNIKGGSGPAGAKNQMESENEKVKAMDTDELTNINELSAYMENILHIPKKMPLMAEMMYL